MPHFTGSQTISQVCHWDNRGNRFTVVSFVLLKMAAKQQQTPTTGGATMLESTGSRGLLPLLLLFWSSGRRQQWMVAVLKDLKIGLSSHLLSLSTPRLPTFAPSEPRRQLHIKKHNSNIHSQQDYSILPVWLLGFHGLREPGISPSACSSPDAGCRLQKRAA